MFFSFSILSKVKILRGILEGLSIVAQPFLEKIFTIGLGLATEPADLLDDTLVGLNLPEKFSLCHGYNDLSL